MSHRGARLAVSAALAAALALAGCSADDDPAVSTSTDDPTTTSTTEAATSSSAPAASAVPDEAVWPRDPATTFTEPAAAATSFATEFLGMPVPAMGEFQQGDSRSGEVQVRPKPGLGPTTTIFVRQLGPRSRWYVIGSSSPNLKLATPQSGAEISSPVDLRGESTAFEATIQTGVRQDGQTGEQYLGKMHTMGGSNGDFAPFQARVTFDDPTEPFGTVVLWVYSAEDGSVSEATVTRVRF